MTLPFNEKADPPDDSPSPKRPASGFLIDPATQSIAPWAYNGDYRTIRAALRIGASPFTIVSLPGRDCIFVDDEGLLKPVDWFFAVKGYPQPIAGRGLVLGTDRKGESVSARTTLAELQRSILHLRIVGVDPIRFFAWEGAGAEMRAVTLEEVEAWIADRRPPPAKPSPVLH
jgi:hypothetical protein